MLERQENEDTAKYLKRLKEMGFLFHGSPNPDIEELEPRYTKDPDTSRNTDTAVFASDNPTWATIFGVYDSKGKAWSTSVEAHKVIASIAKEDRERVENEKGFVYVLPREKFDERDDAGQFKSHEKVKPVLKIPVEFNDYKQLGGEIGDLI